MNFTGRIFLMEMPALALTSRALSYFCGLEATPNFTTQIMDQAEEKNRYSEAELKEFEAIIDDKLSSARGELENIKNSLSRINDNGTDNTAGNMKLLEDGADTLEKESLSQLAARQQKFIGQLENAKARIKNGTYGVCIDTGKLISKERLRAVPHTRHSIEAKLKQQ